MIFRLAPDPPGISPGLHRLMPAGAEPKQGRVKSYIVAFYIYMGFQLFPDLAHPLGQRKFPAGVPAAPQGRSGRSLHGFG